MTSSSKNKLLFFFDECSDKEIIPESLEHAYLAVLNEDLTTAKNIFKKHDSPRGRWGVAFTSILEGYITNYPTYFEIRNFLEIDVNLLLKNEKINYVEQFMGALDFLSGINQETYKFAARVMYENKLYTAALKYMEKSKEIYYNDAELHFMFAKYNLNFHRYNDALYYVNECLKLIPDYYPALILKEEILEKCGKHDIIKNVTTEVKGE